MNNRIAVLVLPLILFSWGCFRAPSEPQSTDTEPGKLIGTVYLERQWQYGGVRVNLNGPKSLTTYSDTSGSFIFFNIPPGRYSVSVKEEWFEPESLEDVTISSYQTTNYGQIFLYVGEPLVESGYDPSWSPFFYSNKFVFTRDISTSPHLLVYNLATNEEINLNRIGQSPQWSPTGTFIAYEIENGGIYRMDPDGANVQQLSHKGCNPAISSDGNKILFHREEASDSGVYVINADGTALTCIDSLGKNPVIAPENNYIAYERNGEIILTSLQSLDEKIAVGYGSKPSFAPRDEIIAYLNYWQNYIIAIDYSGNVIGVYYGWYDEIEHISWSRYGANIFFSDASNYIGWWNAETGNWGSITYHGYDPECSPENELLLFERDGGIKIFRPD